MTCVYNKTISFYCWSCTESFSQLSNRLAFSALYFSTVVFDVVSDSSWQITLSEIFEVVGEGGGGGGYFENIARMILHKIYCLHDVKRSDDPF